MLVYAHRVDSKSGSSVCLTEGTIKKFEGGRSNGMVSKEGTKGGRGLLYAYLRPAETEI